MCKEENVFADSSICGGQPCVRGVNFGVALIILNLHWLASISDILKVD